jgi:hypothetical protein
VEKFWSLRYLEASDFYRVFYGTGDSATYVTVIADIPNVPDPDAYKDVWARVEWEMVEGTGYFDSLVPFYWESNPDLCPEDPSLPFPGSFDGFVADEGTFSPEHGFENGNEMSYSSINPQPACERIEFRFLVQPNSQIDYRIEVQTLCFTPTAVTLSNSGFVSYAMAPFALGVVALGAVGVVWQRRRDR